MDHTDNYPPPTPAEVRHADLSARWRDMVLRLNAAARELAIAGRKFAQAWEGFHDPHRR